MYTLEGKKVDRTRPRQDYPTPQFQRDSFFSLNGVWDFSLDEDKDNHSDYGESIVVPFAAETPLSGIERRVAPNQIMHYRRRFTLPAGFNKGRVLLHFEAVDQVADVFLNGVKIAHHEGGYLPFTVDCLELREGENILMLDVTDDTASPRFPRGKQSVKPGGIWYTPTSGIWGDVWIESVPKAVIQSLRITPLFDEKKVEICAQFEGKATHSALRIRLSGKEIVNMPLEKSLRCVVDLSGHFRPWSPESPTLYQIEVEINEDRVQSYFAMRKFSFVEHNGHRVFALNNQPYFLSGVLDQGYYPDGGLTPPSDEAILGDLRMLKNMGFNCVRKHIKIEGMRWYHHCDVLGLIVIQDFVNLGAPVKPYLFLLAPFCRLKIDDVKKAALLGAGDPKSQEMFESTLAPIVERLYNVPSLAIWTLFNEGWGQFHAVRLTEKLRELDGTRLIDSTSGWFDQGTGDFHSRHVYFVKLRKGDSRDSRIDMVSECGAYSHIVKGHAMRKKRTFYQYYSRNDKLMKAVERLYLKQIVPLVQKGLSAVIYTQLSDVEGETNGLVTYDRAVIKIDAEKMRAIHRQLVFKGEPDS